jgi:hypothetical protein
VSTALEVRACSESVTGPLVREEQEVVAARAESALEPNEHLLEERVLDVWVVDARRKDDSDHVRPLGYEGSSRRGRRVLEFLGQLEDSFAGRRADVVVVVQGARDSGDGDTAQFGQLPDCGDLGTPSENVSGRSKHDRARLSRPVRKPLRADAGTPLPLRARSSRIPFRGLLLKGRRRDWPDVARAIPAGRVRLSELHKLAERSL